MAYPYCILRVPRDNEAMLKHDKITHDRIRQFLEYDLRECLIPQSVAIPTDFLQGEFPDETTARAAKGWKAINPGFEWGPAYAQGWYKFGFEIPQEFRGKSLILTYSKPEWAWERHGVVEGTIWSKNHTIGGLDFAHNCFRLPSGLTSFDFAIQTFAHNKETTVHRPEKPRTPLPEKFEGFLLAELDEDRLAVFYDVEFTFNLFQSLPENDPSAMTILRALNDAVNLYASSQAKAFPKMRRVIREALESLNDEKKHTVTPVGHAHLDTAWLWPLAITHLKMAHTTSVQLDLIDRYPEHVFAHSQASQYEWLEKEHPNLLERVKRAHKKGQWEVIGSMWVEADCNLTGAESLIRQFLYGRRYFKKHFGITTDDMWLPDVFGYSAALPQILSKFGIEFFLTQKLSWNQFNKIPHHTFWWAGIDGSRVWTHFPPCDTYNSDGTPGEIHRSVQKYKDHARCDHSLLPYGFGDGGGGPTEFHVERLRRGRMSPCLPLIESRKKANEFFHRAKAESHDLCTWVGELYFEMHRGTYTSQAANKRDNRKSEFLLRDADLLSCFAQDLKEFPTQELERAWKLVLLNQFHDIIPGSSVREVYEDSDRDYAIVFGIGDRVVEESLRKIGGRLATQGLKRPVALFHNATIPSQVTMDWSEESVPQSLICADQSLPVQLVEQDGKRALIFESPVAALGAVAIGELSDLAPTAKPRLKVASRKLENDEFVVRFDANGNISSIQTLDDNPTEFILPGQLANVFQLLDDRPLFWDAWDTDIYASETAKDLIRSDSFEIVEKGPTRVALELVKTFGKSKIRQRISLGPTPGIRFDTEIDWHEDQKMLKVAFPINVNAQRATFEIQFGHVERSTHQNTSWDLARFEVCAQKWADVSEGGHGVALLNQGKYGHDIKGSTLRMSLLKSPKAPDPICDMGRHVFSYVLLPHFDQIQQSEVVEAAYAFNAEPRALALEPQTTGTGVATPALVSVDRRSLVIETVKKAEDYRRIIVRMYEAHNSRGTANLSCALPIKRAYHCDLNETPHGEPIEPQDGRIPVEYKPFEIITLMLEI